MACVHTLGREVVPLVCRKRAMSVGSGTPSSPAPAAEPNVRLHPRIGVMVHVGAPDDKQTKKRDSGQKLRNNYLMA